MPWACENVRKSYPQEKAVSDTTNINEMLDGRANRYGTFEGHARISQALKRAMQDSPNWQCLTDVQKEGLEMVQHKIARMLNGDPLYLDNIIDIVGYSTLVKDVMETNHGIQGKVE
jgi:hypothetical protein